MKEGLLSLIKSSYLFLVRTKARHVRTMHNKIVYLLSFPSTSQPILEDLYAKFGSRLVICYTENAKMNAHFFHEKGVEVYSIDQFNVLINKVIPLVKGAKTVLCDNYFAFLGAISFFPETEVIQLWHADGAIKKFGIEANYAKARSKSDIHRYQQVYQAYTHYAVGSDKMGKVFESSYQATSEQMLPIGYLPSDRLLKDDWRNLQNERFSEIFSDLKNKRILFYTPTYRETTTENPLDFEQILRELGEDWVFFVKAHPHDKELIAKFDSLKNVFSDLRGFTLQEFLPFVDCLITDYSSVPFEYTLVKEKGKIIFFCYDLDDYQKEVGIQDDFNQWAPGAIVYTQEQLIEEIRQEEIKDFSAFNHLWNQYNDGKATRRLIQRIEEKV